MNQDLSEKDPTVLTSQSALHFVCKDSLPCFTQCCQDVNIFLTPYDVLRLRRSLKISSTELLAKYTRHFLARVTHIPVVQLEMDPQTLRCKLLTEEGCSLYDNRPWACRMFPLDLTSREGEYRLIAEKERCLGLREKTSQNVKEWLEKQGVEPYVEMDQTFQAVMPLSFQPGAGMEAGLGKLLFLAYDLDRFVDLLNDKRFRTFYDVDDEVFRRAVEDDEAMLRLAFQYIRSQMDELYQVV